MSRAVFIIGWGALCGRYGLKRATVVRWIRREQFPAPVELGKTYIGWYLAEVLAWERSRQRRDYKRPLPLRGGLTAENRYCGGARGKPAAETAAHLDQRCFDRLIKLWNSGASGAAIMKKFRCSRAALERAVNQLLGKGLIQRRVRGRPRKPIAQDAATPRNGQAPGAISPAAATTAPDVERAPQRSPVAENEGV